MGNVFGSDRVKNPLRSKLFERHQHPSQQRARKKQLNILNTKKKCLRKIEALAIKPEDLFTSSGLYSAYNDKGIPTQQRGVMTELSKRRMKKLARELNRHTKKHKAIIKKANGDLKMFLVEKRAEVAELQAAFDAAEMADEEV